MERGRLGNVDGTVVHGAESRPTALVHRGLELWELLGEIGADSWLVTDRERLRPFHRSRRNVWFGGGVIVCAGVTVGDNTVVGAGSVVTRDLPAGVLAAGNPARVIRKLDR